MILKGATICHDSVVGANCVVTHNVPPCSVVVGNPARVIKALSSDSNPTHAGKRFS